MQLATHREICGIHDFVANRWAHARRRFCLRARFICAKRLKKGEPRDFLPRFNMVYAFGPGYAIMGEECDRVENVQ